MSEFLKGTYKVDKEITEKKKEDSGVEEEFRKKALNSIGGSMVFVERNKYVWKGDEEDKDKS